jgi:adenine C2-methylase RlmN of 23S rRNA A2503 and tRNA A37
VEATVRREKGHDIDAACGQLRLREEKAGLSA